MKVAFSDSFKKAFKKRVKTTEFEPEFWNRLEIFINEPFAPILRTDRMNSSHPISRFSAFCLFTFYFCLDLYPQLISPDLLGAGEIVFHNVAFQRKYFFVNGVDDPVGTREE